MQTYTVRAHVSSVVGWYGNRQRIVMSLVSMVILIYCRAGTDEVDGCSRNLFCGI